MSSKGTFCFILCGALALTISLTAQQTTSNPQSKNAATPAAATGVTTTAGGTKGTVPIFTTSNNIENSTLYYNATGLGIGRFPAGMLDVNGNSIMRGSLDLSRSGDATTTTGYPSVPFFFQSSAYNTTTKSAVLPYFQFRSEPTGNNTASTGATMNFMYYSGIGGGGPQETGLYINPNGNIHFAPSQTFPITQGPPGPQGPAGPQGSTGPAGPAGPAGSFTLPYSGNGSTGGYVFEVGNIGHGDGLGAFGGQATDANSTLGGYGALLRGGPSAADTATTGSSGGLGLEAIGGDGYVNGAHSEPGGAGAYLIGGYNGGYGAVVYGSSGPGGVGLEAYPGNSGGYAAELFGDVYVGGTLSKAGGSFKIDHPLDPANKYLSHSFVESPDMMNIYNGNVITDGRGEAVVTMPDYFQALNRDFRYQLTVMGEQFAQARIASKISSGHFTIMTDKPGVEISWQVTGVRQDAWANANRIPVEEEKPEVEKGHYLNPELFGHKGEQDVFAVNRERVKPTPLPAQTPATN